MMKIMISKHLEALIQTGEHLYRHHHSDTLCSSFTLDVFTLDVSDTVTVRTQIHLETNTCPLFRRSENHLFLAHFLMPFWTSLNAKSSAELAKALGMEASIHYLIWEFSRVLKVAQAIDWTY